MMSASVLWSVLVLVWLASWWCGAPPPSLGGIVTADGCVTTAAAPDLSRLQRQALEMCFTRMLGTRSAFGRRQDALGVDLALELVEHRLARVGSSGGAIGCVCPGFMGCDLSAQGAFSRG
jgi:hypothetical protein